MFTLLSGPDGGGARSGDTHYGFWFYQMVNVIQGYCSKVLSCCFALFPFVPGNKLFIS